MAAWRGVFAELTLLAADKGLGLRASVVGLPGSPVNRPTQAPFAVLEIGDLRNEVGHQVAALKGTVEAKLELEDSATDTDAAEALAIAWVDLLVPTLRSANLNSLTTNQVVEVRAAVTPENKVIVQIDLSILVVIN